MASELDFQRSMLIEDVWNRALQQLRNGCSEVMFRSDIRQAVGEHGIAIITDRFSAFKGLQTKVFEDTHSNVIRLVPVTDLAPVRTANRAKLAKERMSKVPRPQNSFMLYRQAHHGAVTSANPGMHNNQISKIIGQMWQKEAENVRDSYKAQAAELKRKHHEDNPGYQYQPRKPSDKRKRTNKKRLRQAAGTQNISLDDPALATPTSTDQQLQSVQPTIADLEFFDAAELDEIIGGSPEHVPAFAINEAGSHLEYDLTGYRDDTLKFTNMVDNRNTAEHLQNAPICKAALCESPLSHSQRTLEMASINWKFFESEFAMQKEADDACVQAALMADLAEDKGPIDLCEPPIAGPWYRANMIHATNEDNRQTALAGLLSDGSDAIDQVADETLDMGYFNAASATMFLGNWNHAAGLNY